MSARSLHVHATPMPQGRWQRVRAFHQRHEVAFSAAFFVLGLCFDAFTLGRIDDGLGLIQQAAYLGVLGFFLTVDLRFEQQGATQAGRWGRLWGFREDLIHFLFGSLLSTFTLFFFKSASGITALVFLLMMCALLVANELPRFRRLGPLVRLALYAFCLISYLAYVIPVWVGFLSPWLFLAAVGLSTLPLVGLYRCLRRWGAPPITAVRTVVLPMGAVQLLLLVLYFAKAIPPVPLAVQALGIYHQVEKVEGRYRLMRLPKGWLRGWGGGGDFRARQGDKVNVFVRIFAPRGFKDRVFLRFSYEDPKAGWVETDRIPLAVTGGRELGFRGYAAKANHFPGQWRVEVETEDERTVGVLRFLVERDDDATPRTFVVEEA